MDRLSCFLKFAKATTTERIELLLLIAHRHWPHHPCASISCAATALSIRPGLKNCFSLVHRALKHVLHTSLLATSRIADDQRSIARTGEFDLLEIAGPSLRKKFERNGSPADGFHIRESWCARGGRQSVPLYLHLLSVRIRALLSTSTSSS